MFTIMGVFLLFATLIVGLASMAGNALLVMTGIGPVMQFLGTGPGVLVGFAVAVVFILLGVAFLNSATPQATASATIIQETGASQAQRDREIEKLTVKLRRAEKELSRYRAILADPTAKKRRDEEMLRDRCKVVAQEVRNFALAYGSRYQDQRETAERFKRGHERKVAELRVELDQHGLLTPQERESLMLADGEGAGEIMRMAEVLGSIGVGR